MTDIGFGLIDRRTVIVVLFTMVLANAMFGQQLPIDTSTVGSLFLGIVILTGYTYLARSIFRLPLALVGSIMKVVDELKSPGRDDESKKEKAEEDVVKPDWRDRVKRVLRLILGIVLISVIGIPFGLIWLISLVSSFGMWIEDEYTNPFRTFVYEKQNQYYAKHKTYDGFKLPRYYDLAVAIFGTLDRIGVILLAFLATTPSFRPYVNILGIIGLAIMVVIYTFRGDFTSLVRDLLEKEEKEKEMRNKDKSVDVKNSQAFPLYVKVVEEVGVKNSSSSPLNVRVTEEWTHYR